LSSSIPRPRVTKPRPGDPVQELFASDCDSVAAYCEDGEEYTEMDHSGSRYKQVVGYDEL